MVYIWYEKPFLHLCKPFNCITSENYDVSTCKLIIVGMLAWLAAMLVIGAFQFLTICLVQHCVNFFLQICVIGTGLCAIRYVSSLRTFFISGN